MSGHTASAVGAGTLTDQPLVPVQRELLADMLMTQGEAAAALKEYEKSLVNAPMRLRGFYGAAKAAEASGDTKKAALYVAKLRQLTKNGDSDRAELREMKQVSIRK